MKKILLLIITYLTISLILSTGFVLANADVHEDGVIDVSDLVIIASAFGKSTGDTGFDDKADMNGDGEVDIFDVVYVASRIGTVLPVCKDECSENGLVHCFGKGYQVCGNHDSDSCIEWGLAQMCEEGTSCVDNTCNEKPVIELYLDVSGINELSVSVNGAVFSSQGDITEIEWDWGDGVIDKQWFPATHEYSIRDNYDLKVTARDSLGNERTIASKIMLLPVNTVTIQGEHVSFIDFPEDYFDGIEPSQDRAIEIVDMIYEILSNAYHNHKIPERIYFHYSDNNCGAYSSSREQKIVICKGLKPAPDHAWDVYAHEMGHNIAGQDLQFLYLAEQGYSAFLDEHQAEIVPEYVYQTIKNNPELYPLEINELNSIGKRNYVNRGIQENAYNSYINNGKQFHILQDDVEKATKTGQALSHIILTHTEKKGVEGIRIFNKVLQEQVLLAAGFETKPTQEEMINYISAAHSIALNTDLKDEFMLNLNFPIDNTLYDNYRTILTDYIP